MRRDAISDSNGGKVEVSLSSAAVESCMWIWSSGGGVPATGGVNDGNIHLNVEQATWLRDKLNEFINGAETPLVQPPENPSAPAGPAEEILQSLLDAYESYGAGDPDVTPAQHTAAGVFRDIVEAALGRRGSGRLLR
ncbi:hypothetical protein [Nesterenkonia rhizosphaerae]|uniref:Uncharacterized protein n=1 Tax=Nesterenkonia rhizosphaerae TaxID=1348272 RepID=A0ABP9G3W8_9MICC